MKSFYFFWKAIKIAGSAQKTGSVGLVETRVFFFRPNDSNQIAVIRNHIIKCTIYFKKFLFAFRLMINIIVHIIGANMYQHIL